MTPESAYLIEILKEEARLRVAENERIFGSNGHEQRLAEDICMRAAVEIGRLAAIEEQASTSPPCAFCHDTGWVDDQNWSWDYPDLPQERLPGNGKIRCGCGS